MKRSHSIWFRFKQNTLALMGACFIALLTLISISGAYLRLDKSTDSNKQQLAIARSPMGTEVDIIRVRKNQEVVNPWGQGLFFGGLESEYQEFAVDSVAFTDSTVKGFRDGELITQHGLADVLYPIVENQVHVRDHRIEFKLIDEESMTVNVEELKDRIKAESVIKRTFFLGTDSLGRDLLSRLMSGIIISLSVGLISVLISLTIGIVLGAIAGYFRGWIDEVVMWLINVIWSIPTLLMVIAITLVLGKGFIQVFIAVGLTMWVEVARIVRGQFMSLRESTFIEAGRSMGFSHSRLMLKHMLPNAMGPIIVISAANFASAILIEAGLSFLGIGTQIPMASWGTMIKEHYGYITTDLAYLAYLPGICITSLVLAFTLVGNGLRDALDVRA